MIVQFSALFVALFTTARAQTLSDVVEADDVNFDEVIRKHDYVLMEFYAPWCGHCKNLAPEYEKAATELKGRAILAKLDAIENTESAGQYKVTGFPALKIFRDGKFDKDYPGERTADGIVKFIKQETKKTVWVLASPKDVEAFKAENFNTTIYGVFPNTDSEKYKVFEEAAKDLEKSMRGAVAFAVVKKDSGVVVDGLDKPEEITLTLERFDSSRTRLPTEKLAVDSAAFKKSIEENWVPLWGEMTRYTFGFYLVHQKPVFMLFRDLTDETSHATGLKLAQKYYQGTDSMLFGWIDGNGEDAKGITKRLGLEEDKLPGLLIDYPKEFTYHVIEKGGNPIDFDKAADAIEKFPMGSTVTFEDTERGVGFRGENLPDEYKGKETQKGLTTVIQSNFDEFILEADRDVFAFFWAPFCEKCRKVVQDLEKLSKKLEKKRIRIVKFQASQNWYNKTLFDKNPMGEGFPPTFEPTYWFIPKSTHIPQLYEGKQTFKAMMGFLKKNAKADVEADESEEKEEKKDDANDEL